MRLGIHNGSLFAFGLDGTMLWSTEDLPAGTPGGTQVKQVITRAGGVVVGATDGFLALAGFDVRQGSLLWSAVMPDELRGTTVFQAVTDGRTVVLYSYADTSDGSQVGPTIQVTGVDLSAGKMWTVVKQPGDFTRLLVVDGQAVEYTALADGLSEPGTLSEGHYAGEATWTRAGRLALLQPPSPGP
jgi:hypothetical protein